MGHRPGRHGTMHTHPNYRTVAHNMPEDFPRCLFEVPSSFPHANAWNHAQLDTKGATITTWAHKLKENVRVVHWGIERVVHLQHPQLRHKGNLHPHPRPPRIP